MIGSTWWACNKIWGGGGSTNLIYSHQYSHILLSPTLTQEGHIMSNVEQPLSELAIKGKEQ